MAQGPAGLPPGGAAARAPEWMGWTSEQHASYLAGLESAFVLRHHLVEGGCSHSDATAAPGTTSTPALTGVPASWPPRINYQLEAVAAARELSHQRELAQEAERAGSARPPGRGAPGPAGSGAYNELEDTARSAPQQQQEGSAASHPKAPPRNASMRRQAISQLRYTHRVLAHASSKGASKHQAAAATRGAEDAPQ